MNHYLYRWNLQPGSGIRVEVEVAAGNVIAARQTIHRFLDEHLGNAWVVESVSRHPVGPSGRRPAPTALSEEPVRSLRAR